MVVRHGGHIGRQLFRLRQGRCRLGAGTDPHGRPVAVAVVRFGILRIEPLLEAGSVPRVRIAAPHVLHLPDNAGYQLRTVFPRFQQSPGHRQRHDAVIRRLTAESKQVELLVTVVVPLEAGPCHITDDCA